MPMDADAVMHFETVVLDDESAAWTAKNVSAAIAALTKRGIRPSDEVDAGEAAAAAADEEHVLGFAGKAGDYELTLDPSGAWWFDTPYATLMKGRHTNRPEAIEEVTSAVRALLAAVTPYYGCTWFSNQNSPLWLRTSDAFKAQDGAALQFFSRRYLEQNCGGRPYADPPADSERVAGGQLLIADTSAFGESVVTEVGKLTDYLQTYKPR